MRLFFGIQPDPDTCVAIADWRDRSIGWLNQPVPVPNLHITTAFLGKVEPPQVEELAIEAAQLTAGPIRMRLDELGYFSGPGILWIGPRETPRGLEILARGLRALSRRMGLGSERRAYRPHLTLARNCLAPPPAGIVEPDFEVWCQDLILFESLPTRGGVQYRPVETWPL